MSSAVRHARELLKVWLRAEHVGLDIDELGWCSWQELYELLETSCPYQITPEDLDAAISTSLFQVMGSGSCRHVRCRGPHKIDFLAYPQVELEHSLYIALTPSAHRHVETYGLPEGESYVPVYRQEEDAIKATRSKLVHVYEVLETATFYSLDQDLYVTSLDVDDMAYLGERRKS